MKIKLQRGIPARAAANGKGAHGKYPFKEMKVGDAFYVPGKKSLNGSISYAQLAYDITVKTRRDKDGLWIERVK